MNCNCERIRRRALEHGEGSVEYAVWVRHAQHCEECRSEVYIQSLLRRDTGAEGAGLSSEAVSRLVQLADERYRGGRRRHERFMRLALAWGARAAVFVVLLYGLSLLRPRLFEVGGEVSSSGVTVSSTPSSPVGLASASRGGESGADSSAASSAGASALSEPSGGSMGQAVLGRSDGNLSDFVVSREALERAHAYSHEPEVLPGWSFERRLQSFRERVGVQRENLYDSMDSDAWIDFSR